MILTPSPSSLPLSTLIARIADERGFKNLSANALREELNSDARQEQYQEEKDKTDEAAIVPTEKQREELIRAVS